MFPRHEAVRPYLHYASLYPRSRHPYIRYTGCRFPSNSEVYFPCSSVLIDVIVDIHRATVCNGYAELCNRSYSNITFAGGELRLESRLVPPHS